MSSSPATCLGFCGAFCGVRNSCCGIEVNTYNSSLNIGIIMILKSYSIQFFLVKSGQWNRFFNICISSCNKKKQRLIQGGNLPCPRPEISKILITHRKLKGTDFFFASNNFRFKHSIRPCKLHLKARDKHKVKWNTFYFVIFRPEQLDIFMCLWTNYWWLHAENGWRITFIQVFTFYL